MMQQVGAQKESILQKIEADIYNEKIKKNRELKKTEVENILKKYGTIEYESNGTTIKAITTSDGGHYISMSEIDISINIE